MAGPKFGTPAWRKKYASKMKKGRAKRKNSKRRTKAKNPAAVLKKIKALLK